MYFPDLNIIMETEYTGFKETEIFTLNSELIARDISFTSYWDTHEAVARTLCWHSKFLNGDNQHDLCERDINEYFN
jgi:hypothetical protein